MSGCSRVECLDKEIFFKEPFLYAPNSLEVSVLLLEPLVAQALYPPISRYRV